jgi:GNAT superfamily N-acetyltransferase
VRRRQFAGAEALVKLTTLLHRMRHADATWCAPEAADLHWWWRLDQRPDERDCTVWFDDRAEPALAVTAVHFHDGLLADIYRMPSASIPSEAIDVARDLVARHSGTDVSWSCPIDDAALATVLLAVGAQPTGEHLVETWIDAGDLPPVPACPDGYSLGSRADVRQGVEHHMVARNGPDVERRLQESSLYRADLDMYVSAGGGSVAGYALFWADLETRVGLIEPVRVHDAHQRRGLARYLVLAGAQRLADAGCTRIKVSYMADNPASRQTYLGAGFRPGATIQTYRSRVG